jgi:hypothetical protein
MKANELKVTDLMVGDWVSCQINSIEFKYVRIASLNKTTMNGIPTDFIEFNKVMVDMLHGNYYQVDIASVHPVPLTPEILEKNGFYRSEIPTRDEIGHYYHRKTAPSSIFVSMSFDDGRDFGNEIKYVHELQHVLKLCGIDKEIVV